MKSKKSSIKYVKCRSGWDWILQGLVIILLALLIFIFTSKKIKMKNETKDIFYGIFALIYIAYLLNNFIFSKNFALLLKQKKSPTLHQILGDLFSQSPEIIFIIDFYNPEREISSNYSYSSEDKLAEDKIKNIKVLSESTPFNYLSARDISGTFILDKKQFNGKKKYYINLTLEILIEFADTLTAMDYEKQKNDYKTSNRWKGKEMKFTEEEKILKSFEGKLIRISEDTPIFCKWYVFALFIIIGLAQFYKLYILYFMVKETFTLKKIISSRYYLDKENYKHLQPKLILFGETYCFENTIWVNKDFIPKETTEEEIAYAKKYENCLVYSKRIDPNGFNENGLYKEDDDENLMTEEWFNGRETFKTTSEYATINNNFEINEDTINNEPFNNGDHYSTLSL